MLQGIVGQMLPWKRVAQLAVAGSSACLLLLLLFSYREPFSLGKFALPGGSSPQDVNHDDGTDWSRFAYVQYVTNGPYLCNSIMLFERLNKLGSKADRVLLYPQHMSADETEGNEDGTLLRKARDEYGAILKPIQIQHKNSADSTWADSFTKLLVFNQTEYSRVLHLDSDSTILEPMDELFLLPPAVAAMPRSYWEAQEPHIKLSSQLMLATPSKHQFERCEAAVEAAGAAEYDMEILNTLFRDTAITLPHKIYDLYTREFRMGPDHKDYLGNDEGAVWDADEVAKKAKFLHFSDWPLPKPWIEPSQTMWEENMPHCFDHEGVAINDSSESLCRERELWVGFYKDFKARRKDICGD